MWPLGVHASVGRRGRAPADAGRGLLRVRTTRAWPSAARWLARAVPRKPLPPAMTMCIGYSIGQVDSGRQLLLTNRSVNRMPASRPAAAGTRSRILAAACRRVRRPRLRRHHRRSHRPPRPRQQGDDLLPLPQQARPLHGHRPRAVYRHHRASCARSPPSRLPLDRKLDRLIETLVQSVDELHALSADFLARNRRRRRPSGSRGARADCGIFATVSGVIVEGRELACFSRCIRRWRISPSIGAARHVSRDRAGSRADQGRAARRNSRSRFRHARRPSADGRAARSA